MVLVFEVEILERKFEDEMIGYVYDIWVKDVFRVCVWLYFEVFSLLYFFCVFKYFLLVCLKFFKLLIYRIKIIKWMLKDLKLFRERGGVVFVGYSC